MDDLISRQAAIDSLSYCQTYLFYSHDDDKKISLEDAEYELAHLPTAKPRRGKWIEDGCITYCDQCMETKRFPHWKYCPNCGARMTEE